MSSVFYLEIPESGILLHSLVWFHNITENWIFCSFSIKQVLAQLQHDNWIWKQLTIQLDCTKFLSLAYILLRLSSLFLRYSKLVSTVMHKLLRSSKILLHHVLVKKTKLRTALLWLSKLIRLNNFTQMWAKDY